MKRIIFDCIYWLRHDFSKNCIDKNKTKVSAASNYLRWHGDAPVKKQTIKQIKKINPNNAMQLKLKSESIFIELTI